MTDDFESIIRERFSEIHAQLEQMTKEQRLRYFKNAFLEDFKMEDGDSTYIIRTHFSDKATESLHEKAERFASKAQEYDLKC